MTLRWRIIVIVLLSLMTKYFVARYLPVVEDEAYYAWWSRVWSWGYLDHPPLVAWLGKLSIQPVTAFRLRIPDLVLTSLAVICFTRLCRFAEMRTRLQTVEVACSLFLLSAGVLIFGVLHTPDVGVSVCWILCIHEVVAAIGGRRKRWLSAGAFAGIGAA